MVVQETRDLIKLILQLRGVGNKIRTSAECF